MLVFALWFLGPQPGGSKPKRLILEGAFVHMAACCRLSWGCGLQYSPLTFVCGQTALQHAGWVPRSSVPSELELPHSVTVRITLIN